MSRKKTQLLNFQLLSDTQKAYIAGFLDGDGSIVAQFVSKDDYIMGFQIRISVIFTQKKKRKHFLQDLSKEISLGSVGSIRDRKEVSDYTIVGVAAVQPFLTGLLPYLKIKNKQAKLVLHIISQLPSINNDISKFNEVCDLVDQVAALNDSKKRTIIGENVKLMAKTLLAKRAETVLVPSFEALDQEGFDNENLNVDIEDLEGDI